MILWLSGLMVVSCGITSVRKHPACQRMRIYIYILFCLLKDTKRLVNLAKPKWQGNSLAPQLVSLQWRHDGHDSVSNHQPHDCLLNHLFRRRSKKPSKLRVTGLCAGNSPGTCEFPAQMASNAENVSIWWRHHICTTHSRGRRYYVCD